MTFVIPKTYEVLVKVGDDWVADSRLAPAVITDPVWPELPTAEIEVLLGFGPDPETDMRMEEALSTYPIGTQVIVREAGEEGAILFLGVVTGPTATWGPGEERVRLACMVSTSIDDLVILGAWGRGYADYTGGTPITAQATWFPGLRPVFNEGRAPNRSVTAYTVGGATCSVFSPPDFAFPSSPLTTWWTSKDVLKYLFRFAALADVLDVVFPSSWAEGDLLGRPRELDIEGKSWWRAIGEVFEFEGWRCRLKPSGTVAAPTYTLSAWHMGTGAEQTIRLGLAGTAETAYDNAQQGNLNFDASGVVTVPIVYGGQRIFEGTFELVPAWKTADMDYTLESEGREPEDYEAAWRVGYYARYVADSRATLFASYRDVGRKWVLNECGWYGADYGSPALFNFTVITGGVWMRRPRPFLKPISRDINLTPIGIKIEFTLNATAETPIWQELTSARPLHATDDGEKDECGIRITEKDLSKIVMEKTGPTCGETLWDALCDDAYASTHHVKVRISACVADDGAVVPDPALGIPAWAVAPWRVERAFDRRERYRRAGNAPEPYNSLIWMTYADSADDTVEATAEAAWIQNCSACLSIRGPIVMPGVDWPHDLGQRVTEIAGRSVPLLTASGPYAYPEIVRRTRTFGKVYATEIVLEDPRMRGQR